MLFQNDWVMRQIEMMTGFVAHLVFHKTDADFHYEVTGDPSDSRSLTPEDMLYFQLLTLIREGRLCQAEDLLYDRMVYSDKYTELVMDFFTRLNAMTDEQLESGGLTRQEVFEDYIDMMTRLGIPVEVFAEAERSDSWEL